MQVHVLPECCLYKVCEEWDVLRLLKAAELVEPEGPCEVMQSDIWLQFVSAHMKDLIR